MSFFTGPSEWMVYIYTLWMGSTNFTKTLRHSQKRSCQKSDIKGVHNLRSRLSLCVVAHTFKILWECLPPHPELQVTLIAGDTWNVACTCLLETAYIEIQTVIMETIKHILNVSKSIAW